MKILSDFPKKWRIPIVVFFILSGIAFLALGFKIEEALNVLIQNLQ